MKTRLRYMINGLWYSLVAFTALIAILLTIARLLIPTVDTKADQWLSWINSALPVSIEANTFHANWHGLWPEFILTQVKVWDKTHTHTVMAAAEARLQVNPYQSWRHGFMIPHRLRVKGLQAEVQEDINGHFHISGFPDSLTDPNTTWQEINNILLSSGSVFEVVNGQVNWQRPSGMVKLSQVQITVVNAGSRHQITVSGKAQQQRLSSFQVALDFWGTPHSTDNFEGNGFFKADNIVLSDWHTPFNLGPLAINKASGSAAVWLGWNGDQVKHVVSQFDWQSLSLQLSQWPLAQQLAAAKGELFWHVSPDAKAWRLVGHDLQLVLNDKASEGSVLSASKQANLILSPLTFHAVITPNENAMPQLLVALDSLPLAEVQQLIKLGIFAPTAVAAQNPPLDHKTTIQTAVDWFNTLQPIGHLQRLLFSYNPTNNDFSVDTEFAHLGIKPYKNWPGFQNASGSIHLSQDAGWLALMSHDMQFNMDNLFAGPLNFDTLQAKAVWSRTEKGWQVQADPVLATQAKTTATAKMSLLVPFDSTQSPDINLTANVDETDAKQALHFLPMGIFSPNLVKWLNRSIESGKALQTQITLQGLLHDFPFAKKPGQFDIRFHVVDGRLHYLPDWPVISHADADVRFVRDTMAINVNSGRIFDSVIGKTSVTIPVIEKDVPAVLHVDGTVTGNSQDGLRFLKQSPLWQKFGQHLSVLDLSGPMALQLGFIVSLEDNGPETTITGKINLQKNSLSIPKWDINIDDILGSIAFTQDGLTADQITGQLWNAPLVLKMSTETANKLSTTVLNFKGSADSEVLRKNYPSPVWEKIKGETNYTGTIRLEDVRANKASVLTLQSDLKGVQIELPGNYTKTATEAGQLMAEVVLRAVPEITVMGHIKGLSTALLFKNSNLDKGTLRFGDDKPAALPTASGLQVSGNLDKFVVADWKQLLTHSGNKSDTALLKRLPIRSVDLTIDNLDVFGHVLHAARVQAARNPPYWLMNVSSKEWRGQVWLPDNLPKQTIIVNMQACGLQEGNTNSTGKPFTLAELKAIPPLEIQCKQFTWKGQDLGNLLLKTAPGSQGLQINQFTLTTPVYQLNLTGSWRESGGKMMTSVIGKVDSSDIAASLRRLNIKSNLQGSQGNVKLDLYWPGAPYDVRLATIKGKLNAYFVHGTLVGVEPGLGRLLSVLSVETFVRRLKVGLSDLFAKGFSVDSIKAPFELSNGDAYTSRLVVTGPAATIYLQGSTNLIRRDYDFNVSVVPHVTASLPLAATIASGNPLVGAAVWLVDKMVLNKEFKKLSRYDYRVTGTWDKPQVTSLSDTGR